MEPRIVCAALLNTETGDIICSPRHFDTRMHDQLAAQKDPWVDMEQGFVDQRGNFYDRADALEIAKAAGQIRRRVGGDESRLFSENLY